MFDPVKNSEGDQGKVVLLFFRFYDIFLVNARENQ